LENFFYRSLSPGLGIFLKIVGHAEGFLQGELPAMKYRQPPIISFQI
jgi:hypothetical protein